MEASKYIYIIRGCYVSIYITITRGWYGGVYIATVRVAERLLTGP
jgi:hypothetical protein